MNAVVELKPGGGLASLNAGRMATADIIAHLVTVQEVLRTVMKPDVHYGVIPGTDKPTLYKSGAEVLCMVFRIAQSYEVTDMSTADVVRYRSVCTGSHQMSGMVLGAGMGEASSGEEKYKWRKAYQPEYDATPENLRRKKQGYNKQKREHYDVFQVRTEPADLANTILKMANKRAMLAMVLNVTAASDCFTQDLEDMDEKLREHLSRHGDAEGAGTAAATAAPTFYPQADFEANLAVWKKVVAKTKKPEDVIAKINAANPDAPLSDAQKVAIRALMPAAEAQPATGSPGVSHADVLAQLATAKDEDVLNTTMDLANTLTRSDEEARSEESAFDKRLAELRG
ncbi:MAG: hypothetical protein V4757_07395 [Pseudomonadota bacterium]